MSRPNVVLVSHNYPPHLGGLEVVVQEEAHRLAERGADVTVVTSATSAAGGGPGLSQEKKVAVRRVPAWAGLERAAVPFPVFSPSLLLHLWTAIRRADLVHIHDTLYITSWLAAALCRLLRRPYVVTLHVGMVDHPSRVVRLVQHAVRRTASRFVTRRAERLLSISDFVAAANRDLAHDESLDLVLPNGVDTALYRPAVDTEERRRIRRQLGLPVDEKLALYVGRFVPKKGFDLLRACRHHDFRVVFVGGDRPPGDPDRNIFLGRLDAETLARVYRAVDLFVSASVGECPLTVLEAMSSGLPVLLNDDPGHRALDLADDAVRWAPLRGGSLAETVAEALRDEDRLRRQAASCRVAAEGRFSWDAHADRLWEVYSSVSPAVTGRRSRTKVAVVTPYFAPSVGGVESYTAHLVEALRASDEHDVLVVTTSGSRRSRVERLDGTLVVRLSSWFTVSNTPVNPLWVLWLPLLLRRHGVDVVNVHSPVPFLADVATVARRRAPVVLTYHSGSMVKGVGGPVDAVLRWYERRVLPRVLARAEVLLAVSPVALTHRRHRAELVPPGVDTARFTYAPDGGALRVLYVGRIERSSRWKGLHVLLDAFAKVVERLPAAELHLVGSGDGVRELAARAEGLGVRGAVTMRGTLRGNELVAAYQESSVVVLPSLTEGESLGMTLVEAMACGRPVVGSDVGGIRFVVRDRVDGLLTAPGDAEDLADALTWLLLDPELRQEMGAAGRQAAETRWDWSHSTRRTLDILRAAGATQSSRPRRTRCSHLTT